MSIKVFVSCYCIHGYLLWFISVPHSARVIKQLDYMLHLLNGSTPGEKAPFNQSFKRNNLL